MIISEALCGYMVEVLSYLLTYDHIIWRNQLFYMYFLYGPSIALSLSGGRRNEIVTGNYATILN